MVLVLAGTDSVLGLVDRATTAVIGHWLTEFHATTEHLRTARLETSMEQVARSGTSRDACSMQPISNS